MTEPFVEHGTGCSKVHYCDGDRPTEQDRANLEAVINAPDQAPVKLQQALHEAATYGIGATSDTNQKVILEAERRCQKCGDATKGEEAYVDGQIWCHPCADTRCSAGRESAMQRLLAAAGWDAGSIRHKQLEDALDGAGLSIVDRDKTGTVKRSCPCCGSATVVLADGIACPKCEWESEE
jgi:ribosomal protein S27AE